MLLKGGLNSFSPLSLDTNLGYFQVYRQCIRKADVQIVIADDFGAKGLVSYSMLRTAPIFLFTGATSTRLDTVSQQCHHGGMMGDVAGDILP